MGCVNPLYSYLWIFTPLEPLATFLRSGRYPNAPTYDALDLALTLTNNKLPRPACLCRPLPIYLGSGTPTGIPRAGISKTLTAYGVVEMWRNCTG